MRSVFTVVTPATDPTLLTAEQLRAAAGLASNDTSRDVELTLLGQRVAAEIFGACRVRSDGVNPPTLRKETVRETLRQRGCDGTLFLARLFVVRLVSVTDADVALEETDTLLDGPAGMLQRICGTRELPWQRGDAIVEYEAGFEDVPADLTGIAMDLCRLRLSANAADPLERATTITIPDVESRRVERWVGAVPGSNAGPLPADIMARLGRFICPSYVV